ncbi:hypothetical protein [Streptomyces sp. NPDC047525]|uniref:hypothetical protein n=1 Tax=Streptomyces sp. NPDC047525 TaxID=3155264 RepID=UPI0033F529B0
MPVGLAVLLLGRRFIPASTVKRADRLDLTGMLLSALAIVLIRVPAHQGRWDSPLGERQWLVQCSWWRAS